MPSYFINLFISCTSKQKLYLLNFQDLLNIEQKKIYDNIVYERIMIYVIGMLLGIGFGILFYIKYPKSEYLFCKLVCVHLN